MNTIPNRVAECKSMQPIHTRQAESDKIAKDVEIFLSNPKNSIYNADAKETNFKSDLAKDRISREEAKKRKAGVHFRGDNK